MLNGLLNLCYKELVKGKIQNLNNNEYKLPSKSSKIIEKIDWLFINLFKITISLLFILLAFNLNIYIGITVILSLVGFIFVFISSDIKLNIVNASKVILEKFNVIVDKKIKSQIMAIVTIGILYFFSDFKKMYISIFIFLNLFTIFSIYSNINKNNNKKY